MGVEAGGTGPLSRNRQCLPLLDNIYGVAATLWLRVKHGRLACVRKVWSWRLRTRTSGGHGLNDGCKIEGRGDFRVTVLFRGETEVRGSHVNLG